MPVVMQASKLFKKRKNCLEVLVPVCSLVGGGVLISIVYYAYCQECSDLESVGICLFYIWMNCLDSPI